MHKFTHISTGTRTHEYTDYTQLNLQFTHTTDAKDVLQRPHGRDRVKGQGRRSMTDVPCPFWATLATLYSAFLIAIPTFFQALDSKTT